MINAVLFDLDGTLLPMDQEVFIKAYLGGMGKKLAPYGYDPDLLAKAIWMGTGAMTRNDGTQKNEEVFWQVFNSVMGKDCRKEEHLFMDFYRNEFQKVKDVCGYTPKSLELIRMLQQKGIRLILATNPLFPPIATQRRIRWAGLQPEDFAYITTYDNSSYCKPNPDYYREILGKLGLRAENCLMVGNDAVEDMAAREVGMQVFLLKDCLINKDGRDLSSYPQGGFPELMAYIGSL